MMAFDQESPGLQACALALVGVALLVGCLPDPLKFVGDNPNVGGVGGNSAGASSAGSTGVGGAQGGGGSTGKGGSGGTGGVANNCGDGTADEIEACDDGNSDPGDGCDADCRIEPGWSCTTAVTSLCCESTLENDAANCGACDHDCLGTTCTNGICEATFIVAGVTAFDVDETSIYFAQSGATATVFSCSLPDCSGTPTPRAMAQNYPHMIKAHSSGVYWTNEGTGANGALMKLPSTGGGATPVATSQAYPWYIAFTDTQVLWTNSGVGANSGSVAGAALTGGGPTPLVPGENYPFSLAANSSRVFWTASSDGLVRTAKLVDGVPMTIASDQSFSAGGVVGGIAADEINVYWLTSDALRRMPVAGGGSPITMVSKPDADPAFHSLAIDDVAAYWTSGTAVNKISLSGGQPLKLADAAEARAIEVDAQYVYFADSTALYRVAK